MMDDSNFKPGPHWEGKMAFAPGVPVDPQAIPTVHYQVLLGRVYTLTQWKDGSTARGETSLASLEGRAGQPITKEGWYDVRGRYIGIDFPGGL